MPGKGSEQIQFQSSIYSHHQPQSSIYSHHQPWWCGGGRAWENASKSSAPAPDQLNGSMTSILNVVPQSETNEGGGVAAREYQNQNMEHTLSSTSFTLDKHLVPNPQMELAGPSVVLTPPYLDAQYGQMLATHGQPVMINPQFYGMPQPRMPLPIAMEEEPVYVNAKQYHGILRRRQSRAKAELAKKVIKNRKPYLHESRHLHAMRRARGNGGRFLNTKKPQNNNSSSSSDQGNHTGANPPTNSLSTQHLFINNNENLNSSNASQFTVQNMDRVQNFNIGYHTGNSLTTLYHPQLNGREGDCFGKERDPNRGFK